MTTRQIHRPARVVRPPAPGPSRPVEAPPTLPEGKVGTPVQALLPMAGVASSLTMMIVFRGSTFAGFGALVLLAAVGGGLVLLLSQRGRARRTRHQQRERYLDYLEEVREQFAAQERRTRADALVLDPPPAALWDIARDPARRWERRRADPDMLALRIGTGELPAAPIELRDQGTALTPTDPFMLAEARALARRFGAVPGLPLLAPIDRAGNVSIVGELDDALAVARALVTRLAVTHAPDDVALALAHPPGRAAEWRWARWLPHVLDPGRRAGAVSARRIAPGPAELAALLGTDLERRAAAAAEARRGLNASTRLARAQRLVVVQDTWGGVAAELPLPDQALSAADLGVTVIHLVADRVQEPAEVGVRITVDGDALVVEDLRHPEPITTAGTLDEVPPGTAEALARMLAPLRLAAEADEEPEQGTAELPALLGIAGPAEWDPAWAWAPRSGRDFLRVPIGTGDDGQPFLLDLKEPAQLGMGPHGLCVGATGSGKSELLRTLVLSLLVTHPPDRLAMVLVDYKGGATFAPFEGAPQVAGVITNLADDAALVERVHTSLAGEVQRRQQVLADAGNVANITDYQLRRAERPELPPLPHLLVIIDEFGELLAAKPELIELFLTIGRVGRSIGVHLLLASQRIEGGRLKGLDTYLSYRLGLRTFSEAESRTVLDTPDAFALPPLPGFGYLKVDTTVYSRFKAGYVSGPYRPPSRDDTPAAPPRPLPLGPYDAEAGGDAGAVLPDRSTAPSLLDTVMGRLRGAAAPVPSVWLPPLPAALPLDHVTGPPVLHPRRGVTLERDPGRMRVPLGLLDDPARQRQGVWMLDLRVAGGHAAVIGGPQSGKTTMLRTLAVSLALTSTPDEVAVYGLDLAGGGLAPITPFPHVGGVAGRSDRERLRRTCEELRGMLDHREEVFRAHGIDSVQSLRARHAAGELPELPSAEIVLLVDGFGAVRSDFEELEPLLTDLLQRGGGYGIHVVASLLRWNDVRIALQATFGTRLELRLGDPADSSIDRRLAATLSGARPGRVLTQDKLLAQVALPRVDGLAGDVGLGDAVAEIAKAAELAWPGRRAPRVRVLPSLVHPGDLPSRGEEPDRVPVGLDERALEPVVLDLFDRDQHLVVLGDGECGKTNLLRHVAMGLADRWSPDELVLALFDPRRGLREVVGDDYVGGWAGNSKISGGLAAGIAKELERRMPAGDVTPTALADGPWFTGPRIVLLVDDYDVLTTAGQQPLAPFVPYLPSARDIGLHVVVARRHAGAARAVYEPFLQTIMETGATGLVMAGERSEGQLFPGVWATRQPAGRGFWVRRGERTRLIQTTVAAEPGSRPGERPLRAAAGDERGPGERQVEAL
jgi:S-DNA-T family DNA segregation ATPase FtsK/SpoIIIE